MKLRRKLPKIPRVSKPVGLRPITVATRDAMSTARKTLDVARYPFLWFSAIVTSRSQRSVTTAVLLSAGLLITQVQVP
jgi:hypothetical protein